MNKWFINEKKAQLTEKIFVCCALILFVRLEYIILSSRPVGYPNGNFLVRDTLKPAFVFDFNIEKTKWLNVAKENIIDI